MRNNIALILLYLSWPVCLVHRFWNKAPERKVSWIRFDKTVSEDFRWVFVYNELWISATFVLLAFLICTTKTKRIRIMLRALLWISGVDIVNYWLFFRRNENMLLLEGLMMLAATVLNLKKDSKPYHEKAP